MTSLTSIIISSLFKFAARIQDLLSLAIVKSMTIFPPRLRVLIKERLTIVRRMDYGPQDIFLTIDSHVEFMRIFSCRKEPETIKWIETHIRPGDVVYDIGANVGAYALVIDKFTRGLSKVYAFEPSFSTFAQLSKNIFLNRCQGRIIPLPLALSDKTGLDVFNYSSVAAGTALHALGKPIDYKGNDFVPVLSQQVIAFRIDDLITYFGIEQPNHIKLDVDGIELLILHGAERTLSNPSFRTVIVEVEEALSSSQSIIAFLEKRGFWLQGVHRRGGTAGVANYIFLRQDQNAQNIKNSR